MALQDRPDGVPSDQDIYDRIFSAILDRRLQPGAHLREVQLAEMFGVSRTKVRQALAKLIQVGLAELRPNRGTAVAAPSRTQGRELFDLRRILEPAVAADLAGRRSAADVERLRRHVAREDEARAAGQEALLIRHTGEFHLMLAQLLGNDLIHELLKELEALTCLTILSYARTGSCACLPDEHHHILQAVADRDAERARSLMATHLDHVRAELDLDDRQPAKLDLSAALGMADAPVRRAR